MGKPRQRAVGILGLQHQSGRCGSRASGRTSKESIANGGRPTASGGPFDSKPIKKFGGLATRRASSTRRRKSRAASATARYLCPQASEQLIKQRCEGLKERKSRRGETRAF